MLTLEDALNIALLLATMAGLGVYVHAEFGRGARVRRRLNAAITGDTPEPTTAPAANGRERFLQILSFLGRHIPLFNSLQRREMQQKLLAAGYRQPRALTALMGASAATALLLVSLVTLLLWDYLPDVLALRIGMLAITVYVGLTLPRIVLDKQVRRRQIAISDSFPDALDLMVICSNAGLGLNATIQRVAQELTLLAPELSDEFSLTSAQLQLSGETSAVLQEMADRIGLDSLRSLATTLAQSRQYGTPISESLRILAASERTARRMRTEEAAAKLAAKMTLPMMLFILPTVLLISGGPAVLGLIQAFAN